MSLICPKYEAGQGNYTERCQTPQQHVLRQGRSQGRPHLQRGTRFFLEKKFLENFFGIFLGGGNIHTRPTITNNWVPGRLQLQMGISCFDTMRRKKKTC